MVTDGVTVTDIGDEFPEKTVPSDNVPFHGPVPVALINNVADWP